MHAHPSVPGEDRDTLWSFGYDQIPIPLKTVEVNVWIAVVTRDIQTVCLPAHRLYGHFFFGWSLVQKTEPTVNVHQQI
jgi:hypothetical protein